MGLSQTGNAAPRQRGGGLAGWRLPVALIATGGLAALCGAEGLQALRYDRTAIGDGELWRLLSGHLVHLGWGHYLLNAAGLALVWLLVGHALTTGLWLCALVVIIAVIDVGFWFLNPQLAWYVGLSGALHGLLVLGLMLSFAESVRENAVLVFLVSAKLVYEQWFGPLPGSESTAGGAVVVDAHLYGAIGGATVAGLLRIRVRKHPSI